MIRILKNKTTLSQRREIRRMRLAKWLDAKIGPWIIRLLALLHRKPQATRPGIAIERILFIKLWGIGSIVLAEPALRFLRQTYPAARLEFLTLARNTELFALLPAVDRVHGLEFTGMLAFVRSCRHLLRCLRQQKYDLVFDAEFFANISSILAHRLRPGCLIGFTRGGIAKNQLLDVAVPFLDSQHAAENFLRLAQQQTASIALPENEPACQPRLHLPDQRPGPVRPYIVINANASVLALERRWPPAYFALLGRWLLQEYAVRLLFVGTAREKSYCRSIIQAIDAPLHCRNLAGTLTLPDLAAVLQDAALCISNDSGPLHLAAALGRPVVAFYGPETPQRFGPLCQRKLVFYENLPCSPCMSIDNGKTVHCTNNRQCMQRIQPQNVILHTRRFIQRQCPDLVRVQKASATESRKSYYAPSK